MNHPSIESGQSRIVLKKQPRPRAAVVVQLLEDTARPVLNNQRNAYLLREKKELPWHNNNNKRWPLGGPLSRVPAAGAAAKPGVPTARQIDTCVRGPSLLLSVDDDDDGDMSNSFKPLPSPAAQIVIDSFGGDELFRYYVVFLLLRGFSGGSRIRRSDSWNDDAFLSELLRTSKYNIIKYVNRYYYNFNCID